MASTVYWTMCLNVSCQTISCVHIKSDIRSYRSCCTWWQFQHRCRPHGSIWCVCSRMAEKVLHHANFHRVRQSLSWASCLLRFNDHVDFHRVRRSSSQRVPSACDSQSSCAWLLTLVPIGWPSVRGQLFRVTLRFGSISSSVCGNVGVCAPWRNLPLYRQLYICQSALAIGNHGDSWITPRMSSHAE